MRFRTQILLSAILWVIPKGALACSCAHDPRPIDQQVRDTIAKLDPNPYAAKQGTPLGVFRGRALSVTETQGGQNLIARVVVDRVWFGLVAANEWVVTSKWGASCGFPISVGSEYVFFAQLSDGIWKINSCGLTRHVSLMESAYPALGPGRAPLTPRPAPDGLLTAITCCLVICLALRDYLRGVHRSHSLS